MKRNRALALALPDRIVPMLMTAAAALVAVYIALMITTIFFAAWQTQLARGIDDTRSRIHDLEAEYYDAIAKIDSTDPSSFGLVTPTSVKYVAGTRPGLTFADR